MKESYALTAYHCRNCGGITNPDKEYCDYCSGKLLIKRIKKQMKKRAIRVLIECDKDYVYFDEILSLGLQNEPEMIETTSLEDSESHLIHGRDIKNEVNVEMPLTERGMQLQRKLNDKSIYKTRIEVLEEDLAFEQESKIYFTMPECTVNSLLTQQIILEPYSPMRSFNTVVPDNVCCPNCGAPIKSRYGACDYCGGWVEWSF